MNLEDLRSAQTRERATDGLQELRDSFYVDVADYLEELKERREDAAQAAVDPFGDPEVQELTDKIETAEQVAEAIYERRMGKLVKQASLAAAGMPDDENGLTAEERELYADLVERIEENKSHVLDVISGDAETDAGPDLDAEFDEEADDASVDSNPREPGSESSAAAAMGSGVDDESATESDSSQADQTPEDDPTDVIAEDLAEAKDGESDDESEDARADGDGSVDRMTVRVTDDVGEILGVDERPYTLEPEDVVTLPEENAAPLVEKDAAEKLD